MNATRLARIVLVFLFFHHATFAQADPKQAHKEKASEHAASFAFEPLDRWKSAVLSGNKGALTAFYTTSPPARAKTPRGETQDPGEEPAFWTMLRQDGLDRLDVKVLEAKTL